MAIDRVPSLKRCRALGLETAVVGLAKSSKTATLNVLVVNKRIRNAVKETKGINFIYMYGVLETVQSLL